MLFQNYIDACNKQYQTGIAREHAYRPALQNLLEAVIPDVTPTNDPARIECGAPDFILSQKNIDVGYIEAKDVGLDLNKIEREEQVNRYLESLDNFILTDYLEFRLYRKREKVETVRIGNIINDKIISIPENYERLQTILNEFAAFQGQTINQDGAGLLRSLGPFCQLLNIDRFASHNDPMKAGLQQAAPDFFPGQAGRR